VAKPAANFGRNGFLPFHDGTTRWYQEKDLSDVIMGDGRRGRARYSGGASAG
jgi:hypothetical protein